MSRRNPVKDFRDWYGDMLNRGLEFILALLAFCRATGNVEPFRVAARALGVVFR